MRILLAISIMLSFNVLAQMISATTNANGAVTDSYVNAPPMPTAENCRTQMNMSDAQIIAYLNPVPTPVAPYASALAAGISITSTTTPVLNASYSTMMVVQSDVAGIAASIGAGQGLSNVASTIDYPDATAAPHAFTAAQRNFRSCPTQSGTTSRPRISLPQRPMPTARRHGLLLQ